MPDLHANKPADIRNPWRRLTLTLIPLISLAVFFTVIQHSAFLSATPAQNYQVVDWVLCVIWSAVGVWLIRRLRHAIFSLANNRLRPDMRIPILIARFSAALGYTFVALVSLNLLHIQISSILVGGAITGVIVGIGAQSTLSNLFAGFILFTLRPFAIGQSITLRTWMFSGIEYCGVVQDVNWYYTELLDGTQKRILPNSSIIISAITINADEGEQLFDIALPFTTSVHSFRDSLAAATSGQARAIIREFGENTYSVHVRLPRDIDSDVVRAAIAQTRGQGT